MSTTTLETRPCVGCKKVSKLTVPTKGLWKWREGEHIQDALPELTAEQRELLISGTCGECWDKMMEETEY